MEERIVSFKEGGYFARFLPPGTEISVEVVWKGLAAPNQFDVKVKIHHPTASGQKQPFDLTVLEDLSFRFKGESKQPEEEEGKKKKTPLKSVEQEDRESLVESFDRLLELTGDPLIDYMNGETESTVEPIEDLRSGAGGSRFNHKTLEERMKEKRKKLSLEERATDPWAAEYTETTKEPKPEANDALYKAMAIMVRERRDLSNKEFDSDELSREDSDRLKELTEAIEALKERYRFDERRVQTEISLLSE